MGDFFVFVCFLRMPELKDKPDQLGTLPLYLVLLYSSQILGKGLKAGLDGQDEMMMG